ncbi:hypothetical protein C3747_100g56 [Trypanosoma cruzi]|uniref:Uncharacterized protein n=1 Tax=Trypanosoma cruzi TaxID=5693 RepID=A0A2V2WH95_TRYCR|nr:hypothetical protein C3747_100g56 [Trypanosoma cruzi]
MRRVIGASGWRFMVTAGALAKGEFGCFSSFYSSTATSSFVMMQRAHRSQRRERPPLRHQKRPRQDESHQRRSHHEDGRKAAKPLGRQKGGLPGQQTADGGARGSDAGRRHNEAVTPETQLTEKVSATTAGRFSHRHGGFVQKVLERGAGRVVTGGARPRRKQEEVEPRVSLAAFERLLKVHVAMRNNYECLQRNHQVVKSFSMACAEALLHLGLARCRAGKNEGKREGTTSDIIVNICNESSAKGEEVSSAPPPLLLSADTPLYTTPISFPPPPVEALLHMTGSSKCRKDGDSGELLLAAMEVVDGTNVEGLVEDSETVTKGRAHDTDPTVSWGANPPGVESLLACLQGVPMTDIIKLMETVAYFKWIKDEEVLEWKKGSAVEQLRREISALYAATTKKKETTSTPDVSDEANEALCVVEHTSKTLLNRISRVDCVATAAASFATTDSYVHVIDLMLNVLMRVCLWKWPRMSCVDQMSVVLIATFPWFSRDLSVEAASWMTYYHLLAISDKDVNMNHYRLFLYMQRIRRLCWPSVQDLSSNIVRKLFFLRETSDSTGNAEKDSNNDTREMQHEEPEEAETDAKLIPSLKDVACILYGSQEKQRAAYECLLVWLKQSDQFDLRLASPNGRYVGAIGIAIVDIDRFAMERFGSEILKGEWVLLRVSGKNVPALKRVTQCTQTPYALTRLFFCGYHNPLSHIWHGIHAARRDLLWSAWLRSVARPMVEAILPGSASREDKGGEVCASQFIEPLLASLISDVVFQRLITQLVILSLNKMSAAVNMQPFDIMCVRLIETVYTGALVLYCVSLNKSAVDAPPEATPGATKNKSPVEGNAPEQQQTPASVAIRRAFREVISAMVRILSAEHVPLVHRLLDALFGVWINDTARETPLDGIRKEISTICDEKTYNMLNEWLNRRANLLLVKVALLEDPLLRSWQQAVQEVDAGLPTTLPTLMECFVGLLGLLEKRGHPILNTEQKKQQQSAVDEAMAVGNAAGSCATVFTLPELEVILTVFSRAILYRVSTLKTLGLTSISQEFAALMTSLNGDGGDNRDGGSSSNNNTNNNTNNNNNNMSSSSGSGNTNRNNMEGRNTATSASTAVTACTTTATPMLAADHVMLLEKILSAEVESKADGLTWGSLLEAILLHLAPYGILESSYNASSNSEAAGTSGNVAPVKKLEEDMQVCHHKRLVSSVVLFRCYVFATTHDGGWADATLLPQISEQETDVSHASDSGDVAVSHGQSAQLREITWLLLEVFVKNWARNSKNTNTKRKTAAGDAGTTEKAEGTMRQGQFEYILACHALVVYMRLAPLFSTRSLSLQEAYEQFLHSAEHTTTTFGGNQYNGCDLLFLWLAASANALGVHFSPAQNYNWSTVGGVTKLGSGSMKTTASLGEGTMRLIQILAPYVQSETLRMNPRVKFLVNIIVAIHTFGKLGIHMDTGGLNMDQLLLRTSSDRRLLHRHLNLFLVGCSALPSTRHALLNVASFLREARCLLSAAEIDRALVAVALSANAFAKNHEAQADLQQNGDLMDVTHSTAPTMRVPPTQLRHAWNALTRSVLERAEGMPTSVFVRGVQCAGAVACVDTILCQQLLSFLVEFRRDELSLLDWTAILHTARQSFESRRIFEEYLQEPLTLLLLSMSKENGRGNALESQHVISSGKRLVDDLSLFVEALPELFTGDAEFWGLVRTALKVQWIAQFNAASSSEQHQQQLTLCLQDLARSYEWAVRTAGHHELGAIPIV